MDQVQEVKNKTDIVALVSEYVKLVKAGRNFKGNCPFHGEKTPSFMVNPELGIYKCFGCGEGGDVIAFLQKIEGMNFLEALQTLADKAGIKLENTNAFNKDKEKGVLISANQSASLAYAFLLLKHDSGKKALEYLTDKRKIKLEVIEKFGIGYAPSGWEDMSKFLRDKKGFLEKDLVDSGISMYGRGVYDRFRDRIMFPLANARGQILGFSGRMVPWSTDKTQAKYVNTSETEIYHKSEMLYGLHITKPFIKSLNSVVVVEGEMDAIASFQAGVENVVAIKGSAFTQAQARLISRYCENVVMCLDFDNAGDLASRRGVEIAIKEGLSVRMVDGASRELNPKQYKDPGDWAVEDASGFKEAVQRAIPVYDFWIESAIKRHGISGVGVSKISTELSPILVNIEDEIVRAHYIKKLSYALGLSEEIVRKQVEKNKSIGVNLSVNTEQKEQVTSDKGEQMGNTREEQVMLFGILGKKWEELYELSSKYFESEFWKKVAKELVETRDVSLLPAELFGRTSEILLSEEEFDEKQYEEAVKLLELWHIDRMMRVERDLNALAVLGRRKAELTKV